MTGHPSIRIADIGDRICASLKENTAMSIQRNTADALRTLADAIHPPSEPADREPA